MAMYIELKIGLDSFALIEQTKKGPTSANALKTLRGIKQALENQLPFDGKQFELKLKAEKIRDEYFNKVSSFSKNFKKNEIRAVEKVFRGIMGHCQATDISPVEHFQNEQIIKQISEYLNIQDLKSFGRINKKIHNISRQSFIQRINSLGYTGQDLAQANNYYNRLLKEIRKDHAASRFFPNQTYRVMKRRKIPFFFRIDAEATLNRIIDSADKKDEVLIKHHYKYLNDFVKEDNAGGVGFLLRCGVNSNSILNDGNSILHHAICLSHAETVRVLLKQGADPNKLTKDGCFPLNLRIRNTKIIEMLLAAGANVNYQDQVGFTALHYAVFYGLSETVKVLLDHGADPNKLTKDGHFPLNLNIKNAGIIEILLAYGANVNYQDQAGFTALHCAVFNDQAEAVRVLLKNGANSNMLTKDGRRPLALNTKRNPRVARMLKEAAKMSQKNIL